MVGNPNDFYSTEEKEVMADELRDRAEAVMHVCLKCGAESWQVAGGKLKLCECGGQIVGNPRRG